MSTKKETIYTLIARQQRAYGQATALLAPDSSSLSYTQLHEQIYVTAQALHQMGIARHDRVALVLPNGPAMAGAFLAVASVATCAPLNPAYKPSEFEFYLKDLQTKALIVLQGRTSPAADVAHKLNLPVIELCPLPGAGSFQLISAALPAARNNVGQQPDFAQPDDVALLLHTSGTTSRPKLVPLTHANLCASAANLQKTLHLTPDDRCLNIMPLFHIHGLVGALLASLQAGGSVICTAGFTTVRFFEWLVDFQPTWYTAVPTMHQAILAQAEQSPSSSLKHRLRLIRSSSSALPPTVLHQLEQYFQVPVIEAYGMTEAAHQMASNPLPPLPRKPGSVGLAAGPEVAIMDEAANTFLSIGAIGEVVICGENVTSGYLANATANRQAFYNHWFRTGDQGYLDDEGYLFLTGRLKEIINRGGEKIAPREVDEVLLAHPAVAQALTFALPHPRLGETVAAAVVLHQAAAVTEAALREFVATRLAYFKIPAPIIFLNEIPLGPTGKLQRIGFAERLNMPLGTTTLAKPYVAPRTPFEERLTALWHDVLDVQIIGIHDDFLSLGGDSLAAARIINQIFDCFQIELTLPAFFAASTIADLALLILQGKLAENMPTQVDELLAELQ